MNKVSFFFMLSLLTWFPSQKSVAYVDNVIRSLDKVNAGSIEEKRKEEFYQLNPKIAKVVQLNIQLINNDFPETKGWASEKIEKWILSQAGYFSKKHIDYSEKYQTGTNSDVNVSNVTKIGYRPPFYGRAAILPAKIVNPSNGTAKEVGLFDIKGIGGETPQNRNGGHNNGLLSMIEAVREYNYSNMLNQVLDFSSSDKSVVGIYAIIDPIVDIISLDGSRTPAAIVVRQAHSRHFEDISSGKPEATRKTGWLEYDERVKLTNHLNAFGIQPSSHNPLSAYENNLEDEKNLGKVINVQGTLDNKYLFDFGHYSVIPSVRKDLSVREKKLELPKSHWSYELSIPFKEGETSLDHLDREVQDIKAFVKRYMQEQGVEELKKIKNDLLGRTYSPDALAYVRLKVKNIFANKENSPDKTKKLELLRPMANDVTYYSLKDNPFKWAANTVNAYAQQNRDTKIIQNHIRDMDKNVKDHLARLQEEGFTPGEMVQFTKKNQVSYRNAHRIDLDELKRKALKKQEGYFNYQIGIPSSQLVENMPNANCQGINNQDSNIPILGTLLDFIVGKKVASSANTNKTQKQGAGYRIYEKPVIDNNPIQIDSDPTAVCQFLYGKNYQKGFIVEKEKAVQSFSLANLFNLNKSVILNDLFEKKISQSNEVIKSLACYTKEGLHDLQLD